MGNGASKFVDNIKKELKVAQTNIENEYKGFSYDVDQAAQKALTGSNDADKKEQENKLRAAQKSAQDQIAEEETKEDLTKKRDKDRARQIAATGPMQGRRGTILTSPLGIVNLNPAPAGRTLLGS